MSDFSTEQVMQTLALLSTRGFWNFRKRNQERLSRAISEGLEEFKTLNGDWKLIWGPGTYRYLGSAFDSSMMFVVQNTRHPARFAIVVRGTNPVDVYDWLLGDFLAHRQVPWHPSEIDVAPGAKLSLSTALGLKILLNMHAENDPAQISDPGNPGKFDYLLDHSATAASAIQQAGEASLAKADDLLSASPKAPPYDKFRKLARKLRKYQKKYRKLQGMVEQVIGNVTFKVGETLNVEDVVRVLKLRKRLLKTLDKTLGSFTEVPVAMLMPDPDVLSEEPSSGTGLLELLASLAEIHGDKLELFVTGHSKGGALAPALALFLSDTQRNNEIPVPHHYQWNPSHQAKISCYAFAGPTPGNTAFANYFNQQLGRHFFRYANKLDLVTLAWQSEQLRTIAGLYGDSVDSVPGLDLLFTEMAEEVENLDYCHPGEDYPVIGILGRQMEKHVIEFSGPLKKNISSYMVQEVHQHIAAYIEFLDLDDVLDLKDLIGLKA